MNKNTAIMGAVIIFCAGSVMWLNNRFSASDLKKAKKLVRTYSVEHREETFEGFIVRKHGGRLGEWDAEVEGSCRGVTRVQWYLEGNPPTIYQWQIDLSTAEILVVQGSPGGKRLLEEFHAPKQKLPELELPPANE